MNVPRAASASLLALTVFVQCVFAVRLLAGTLYASRGDAAAARTEYSVAIACYERAIRYVPYRGDWTYMRASLVRNVSGHEAALPHYSTSLRLAPFAEQTVVGAIESLIETGRHDEAIEFVERASSITPYDWRVHYLEGVLATIEGRPQDAIAALRAAQESAPTRDPMIQTPLANALYAAGSFAEAEREASQSIRLQPQAPEPRLVRGKAHLAMGHATQAREDLDWAAREFRSRRALGQDVDELLAESEERLASALIAEKRPLEALAPLDRLAGDSPEAAAEAAGRLLLWLQRMGARAPAELWAFAIDALLDVGSFAEVDRSLSRVDEIFSDDPDGVFVSTRARLLLSEGRAGDAFALLADAPEPAKSKFEYRLALAQTHALAGNIATADLEFRALMSSMHVSPRVRRQAAEGLAALPDQ